MKAPNFFHKPAFRHSLTGFVTSIALYGVYVVGSPVYREFQNSFAMKEFKQYGVVGTYRKRFFNFNLKLSELQNLESENEKLKIELAKLDVKKTFEETAKVERELASTSKKDIAYTPETVEYEIPERLTGNELHTLSTAYFKKEEYEKSAVIFDHLLSLDHDATFQTAQNYLMSGISWYHLKNYKIGKERIDQAVKNSKVENQVHRQALLWRALFAKAEGENGKVKQELLQMIGAYPHAEESQLVNRAQERKPADSLNQAKVTDEEEHSMKKTTEENVTEKDKAKEHEHAEE